MHHYHCIKQKDKPPNPNCQCAIVSALEGQQPLSMQHCLPIVQFSDLTSPRTVTSQLKLNEFLGASNLELVVLHPGQSLALPLPCCYMMQSEHNTQVTCLVGSMEC